MILLVIESLLEEVLSVNHSIGEQISLQQTHRVDSKTYHGLLKIPIA